MSAFLSSRSMRITVAICLVIAALTTAAYVLLYHGPAQLITHTKNESLDAGEKWREWAKGVGRDIKEGLKIQPHIIINNRTVIETTSPITELATVEKTFEQEHFIETTWFGSTKRFHVHGNFKAKAGFDLKDAIRLDTAADGNTIRMQLPEARLLSLEQNDISILEDENGLWNKITKEQREEALRQLSLLAREAISDSDLLDQARQSFEQQIGDIVRRQLPDGMSLSIDIPATSEEKAFALPPSQKPE